MAGLFPIRNAKLHDGDYVFCRRVADKRLFRTTWPEWLGSIDIWVKHWRHAACIPALCWENHFGLGLLPDLQPHEFEFVTFQEMMEDGFNGK